MPKEGKLYNYMRISQPTSSSLHFAYVIRDFAVLNIFSQTEATSLPICNSLSTTDFYGYINTGYISNATLERVTKKNPIEFFSDNDTIHGGD